MLFLISSRSALNTVIEKWLFRKKIAENVIAGQCRRAERYHLSAAERCEVLVATTLAFRRVRHSSEPTVAVVQGGYAVMPIN